MNDVPLTSDRFWARLIDGAVLLGLLSPAFGWRLIGSYAGERSWFSWPVAMALFLFPVCYEALMYWCFGTTIGKWVFGLRLVSAGANPELSAGQCFCRALAYQLNLFFSWAVVALALFRPNRTHLADWVAGTRLTATHSGLSRAPVRWFWGFVLVVIFSWSGWRSAHLTMSSLVLRQGSLSVTR